MQLVVYERNICTVRSKVGLSLHRQTVLPCPCDHQGPLCRSGPSPSRPSCRGGYLSALSPEALYARGSTCKGFIDSLRLDHAGRLLQRRRWRAHASLSARSPTPAVLTIIVISHKSFAYGSVMHRAPMPETVLLKLKSSKASVNLLPKRERGLRVTPPVRCQ